CARTAAGSMGAPRPRTCAPSATATTSRPPTRLPPAPPSRGETKIKADDVANLAFNLKTSLSLQDHSAAAAAEAPTAKTPAAEASAKKPTRCMACKKKVGLLGFACRCGGTFCSLHRYVDGHACNFDYKKVDREKIAQQNPLVVAPKIHNKI
uniref:AN1-type domain-containing protein n=1 Tax=Aegilops tauschii subsp. strangulata TaxID=200361 RepID=A0A453Q4Z3_AEGTS